MSRAQPAPRTNRRAGGRRALALMAAGLAALALVSMAITTAQADPCSSAGQSGTCSWPPADAPSWPPACDKYTCHTSTSVPETLEPGAILPREACPPGAPCSETTN